MAMLKFIWTSNIDVLAFFHLKCPVVGCEIIFFSPACVMLHSNYSIMNEEWYIYKETCVTMYRNCSILQEFMANGYMKSICLWTWPSYERYMRDLWRTHASPWGWTLFLAPTTFVSEQRWVKLTKFLSGGLWASYHFHRCPGPSLILSENSISRRKQSLVSHYI